MSKKLHINKQIRNALAEFTKPRGSLTKIKARLAAKGYNVAYPTIMKALNPENRITPLRLVIIREAIEWVDETHIIHVQDDTAKLLTQTKAGNEQQ